jgi:hypothetical protein
VITLPQREDSPPGEGPAAGNVQWTVSAPEAAAAAEVEPIEYCLAIRRMEGLLAGLGMARNRHRELVIQNCMTRALGRWRQEPGADLSALALAEIEDALGRWFSFLLADDDLGGQSPLLVGRAALDACQAARRWPKVLLTYDHLPAAFVEEMRAARVLPTPPELPGNMLEQQLDFWSPRESLTRFLGRWTRGLPGPAAPAG